MRPTSHHVVAPYMHIISTFRYLQIFFQFSVSKEKLSKAISFARESFRAQCSPYKSAFYEPHSYHKLYLNVMDCAFCDVWLLFDANKNPLSVSLV